MVRRRWKWLGGALAATLVLAFAVSVLVDEPLRRTIEGQMNARLKGYTARIGHLDFHPVGFSIDLRDLVLVQDAHPDPPVLFVPRLSASVQWSAILHGRVVADFLFDGPEFHVDRTNLVREMKDPTPVKEHGWQEALEAIYPLKINEFRIRNGSLTYVDANQSRPLAVSHVEAVVNNVRNVRSAPDVYPSPVRIEAQVFEQGRLEVEGRADFLRVPYAGVKGHIALERIGLSDFRPIAARYGFTVAAGTFDASGNVEYAPEVKILDLEEVRVDGLRGDYAYRKRTARPVEEAAKTAAEAAQEVSNKPDVLLRARRISISGATVGFVNEQVTPRYRVFLADTDLVVENFTNQRTEGTARAQLTGRLMGSGSAAANAAFRAERDGPDFDLQARVQNTDLTTLNDLLRAHAKVDVVSGVFSVFAEFHVKHRRVSGYVKPLFRDLQIYEPSQDEDKSLGRKLKEKVADVVGKVLRNRPREEVATVTPIDGPLDDPKASTWEALTGLVRNAFFRAILPGFERERSRLRR